MQACNCHQHSLTNQDDFCRRRYRSKTTLCNAFRRQLDTTAVEEYESNWEHFREASYSGFHFTTSRFRLAFCMKSFSHCIGNRQIGYLIWQTTRLGIIHKGKQTARHSRADTEIPRCQYSSDSGDVALTKARPKPLRDAINS